MKCSYCGGVEFLEGPTGGLAVNLLCANEECRHWFFVNPMTAEIRDLNRIEPSKAEKQAEKNLQAQERKELPLNLFDVGRSLFNKGESALSCIQKSEPYWHEVYGGDLYVLAGFIEAAVEKIR